MRPIEKIAFVALAGVLLAAIPFVSHGDRPRLDGGSSSVEELIDKLLDALHRNDPKALRALRVSEQEYLRVIVPGTVKPGEPPKKLPDRTVEYFWGELDAKSIYSEENLLEIFGGHAYRKTAVKWDKGVQQYAAYKAYKQLRLDLESDAGTSAHLETGSIAEVDGRFKFISFKRD